MEVFATVISHRSRACKWKRTSQKYPGESYGYQWDSDRADDKVHHKCKSLIACCCPPVREFMARSE
jgi:hypothetical protein